MRRLALLIPILASCAAPMDKEGGDWRDSETFHKPVAEIWKACISTMENKGWKFKEKNDQTHILVTEWRTQMSPRWRGSTREMMELRVVSADGGGFLVKVKSTAEVNDNSKNPASEQDAEWSNVGGNDAAADEICYLLKLKIKKPGLDD